MLNFPTHAPRPYRMGASHCSDPLIGNILAGWRYDISRLSPAMRTDYDQHLSDCAHCRRRQHIARTIDVLLLSVSTLSILAFLLATAVLHRIEAIDHLGYSVHVYHTAITISLEAAAIAGLAVSLLLWALIALVTPIPALVTGAVQQHLPQSVRERLMKHAA